MQPCVSQGRSAHAPGLGVCMSRWGNAKGWSAQEILLRFTVFHTKHGRWPVTADLTAGDDSLPSLATVQRTFGTLEAARRAAGSTERGFEGHGGGGRGGGWTLGKARK